MTALKPGYVLLEDGSRYDGLLCGAETPGTGEIVFYASGSCGRYTEVTLGKPSDATITAIVDYIEIDGAYVYEKEKDSVG